MSVNYGLLDGSAAPSSKKWKYVSVVLALALIGVGVGWAVSTRKSSSSSNQVPFADYDMIHQTLVTNIDKSVDPCEDFYHYACGGWIAANQANVPANMPTAYSNSFSSIENMVTQEEFAILNEHFPFVSAYYTACNDTASIDALGNTPLQPWFNQLDAAQDLPSLLAVLGSLQANGLAPFAFISAAIQPDAADATPNRLYLSPNGLASMVDVNEIDMTPQIEQAFLAYGYNASYAHSTAVLVWEMEQALAQQFPDPPVEQGDLIANTSFLTPQQLNQSTGLDLTSYLVARGMSASPSTDLLAVVQSSYFATVAAIYQNPGPDASANTFLRSYLKWHTIFGNTMNYLSQPYRDIAVSITNQFGIPIAALTADVAVAGLIKDMVPTDREQFCLQETLNYFSDYMTHEWVIQDWPQGSMQAALALLNGTYTVVGERIQANTWLDEPTKQAAIVKWQNIVQNVGYNANFNDYSGLTVSDSTAFANLINANSFQTGQSRAMYNTPVNRHIIDGDALIQNAWYDPTKNSINLIAGLLLYPFFSPQMPLMLGIASYGMVIGHEITHGFDNNGRLFNGTGAYVSWWTNASAAAFDQRAQCLVDQYSNYTVTLSNGTVLSINGEQTLGENIADNGGSRISWQTYQEFAKQETRMFPEWTNDQSFFLWFANSWCTIYSDPAMLRQLKNVHSPAPFRVNGPLSNNPAFAQAWNCPASSVMGRSLTSARCDLW